MGFNIRGEAHKVPPARWLSTPLPFATLRFASLLCILNPFLLHSSIWSAVKNQAHAKLLYRFELQPLLLLPSLPFPSHFPPWTVWLQNICRSNKKGAASNYMKNARVIFARPFPTDQIIQVMLVNTVVCVCECLCVCLCVFVFLPPIGLKSPVAIPWRSLNGAG